MTAEKSGWYRRSWFIILLLILCLFTFDVLFPLGIVGLYLMWRHVTWRRLAKWIVTVIVLAPAEIVLVAGIVSATGIGRPASVPTIGSSCLNGPEAVASGPGDSMYVLDGAQLVRIAPGGHVMWRRAANSGGGLASDAHGNVYVNSPSYLSYKSTGSIDKFSPAGAMAAQWPANEFSPATVDGAGTLYAVNDLDTKRTLVRRLSSTSGHILGQWRSRIGSALVSAGNGTLYAPNGFDLPDGVDRVAPQSGSILHRWPVCKNCMSVDALASDTRGNLFAGLTVDGDTPFEIARVTLTKPVLVAKSINRAEEQVAQLAFDSRGDIYVIRSSYARSGPGDTGLDELSPAGSVVGTFRPCHPDS